MTRRSESTCFICSRAAALTRSSRKSSQAFLPNGWDRSPPGCPIRSGCCSSTCASRNGTFWISATIRNTFLRSGPKAMKDLVKDPKTDLFAKIPWGDGQTVLREALLLADHNAYHLGQMLDVRRLLGAWPEK